MGASLHITDSKTQFTTYRAHHGTVTVGGNILLSVHGIGTVELQYLLPDDSMSHVHLNDVMHIFKLQHSFFSWNAVRNRGFRIEASYKYIHMYDRDNKLILTKVFKASLLYLMLTAP